MTKQLSDCKGCKSAELCGNRDWYSWGMIRFCRVQMIWLIDCLVKGDLDREHWPQGEGSSYTDVPISKRTVRDEAYFTKPTETIAEIMTRLNRTGEDGVTLMEDIQSGITEYSQLKSVSKRALNYISGNRRRKEPYKDFKSRLKTKL